MVQNVSCVNFCRDEIVLGVPPEEEGDFAEFGDSTLNSSKLEEVDQVQALLSLTLFALMIEIAWIRTCYNA